jgi:ADP-L-glycero-D-manno-heptose 6-epimerase
MNCPNTVMPDELRGKYQYFTCAHIHKLREAGFDQHITPLEEAVRDYVRNYLMPGRSLGDEA